MFRDSHESWLDALTWAVPMAFCLLIAGAALALRMGWWVPLGR